MSEASQAANKALQKLSDQITCSVCLDTYRDPKVLTCLHVFCAACLERLVSGNGTSLTCPNCRKVTRLRQGTVSQLQSAFYVNHLFDVRDILEKVKDPEVKCDKCEENEAVGYCGDCGEFVCQACINIHKKWKAFMSHKIATLTEVQAEAISLVPMKKRDMECTKHPSRPSEIYCETCKELVCHDCIVKTHRDHEYDVVSVCFPKHRDTITNCLEPLKELLESVNQTALEMDDSCSRLSDQAQTIRRKICEDISLLQDALETRKKELLDQVDRMVRRVAGTAQEQHKECTEVRGQLSSCVEYVSESLKTGTQQEILSIKEKIVARVQQLVVEFDPQVIQRKPEETLRFTHQPLVEACRGYGNLSTTSLYPEKCFATGEGVKRALVGLPASITVHTVDAAERPHLDPYAPVYAELTAYKDGSSVKCKVTPEKDAYHIEYKPQISGSHDLHIKVYNRHIKGSPFTATVKGLAGVHIGTIKALNRPRHLVVATSEEIVTAEKDANCVSVLDLNGCKRRSFGSANLHKPRGVAVGSDKTVFVASEHCVSTFTFEGKHLASVGSKGRGELQFNTPWALAFNPTNNKVYVCDTRNHRIQILNFNLSFSSTFGYRGPGLGNFNLPADISVDKVGNVYVADYDNNRVQAFNSSGQFLYQIKQRSPAMGLLEDPISVCFDSDGFLYVLEHGGDRFSVFNSKSAFVKSFGRSGVNEGEFTGPYGIAVDAAGHVYVSDTGNNRIQVFV